MSENLETQELKEHLEEIAKEQDTQADIAPQKHYFRRFLLTIFILLLLVYIGGIVFFQSHYLPNTTLQGTDISFYTEEEAGQVLSDLVEAHVLTLNGRENITDTISAQDIQLQVVLGEDFYAIKREQNVFLWPLSFIWGEDKTVILQDSYNEQLLSKKVNALSFFKKENVHNPRNAYIGDYDQDKGCYIIVEEYPGTRIYKKKLKKTIIEALDNLVDRIDLEEAGCYSHAQRDSSDRKLNKLLKTANRYVQTQIDYNWSGNVFVLSGRQISNWISIGEKKVTLDEDAIAGWVNEQAEAFDTYGKKRIFTTYDGQEVELKSRYGWKTDTELETAELISAIRKGVKGKRSPEYTSKAYAEGVDDIGDSYVEINLSAQHLYLWIDREVIMESDFVSGNISRGNGTPGGIFGITYKQKDAILRGDNYASHVNYWMPFNGNIGMHDATWRSSFGGNIYLTNGSHGCINLPLSFASQIYEYMEKGFPVICYY